MTLAHERRALADRLLTAFASTIAETGPAALLIGESISLGYFIALSIGIVRSLEQGYDERHAFYSLWKSRMFLRQWKRFQSLPETGQEVRQGDMLQNGFHSLEFKNVFFRYPRTGRYVLHDLSFEITEGGYYAFVGSNGSGKTTIVKLLSGLYENYEGEIRVNGIELREISFEERCRIFTILFQNAVRYQETVYKNIFPSEDIEGGA